ncbi:hypothetical protein [Natrinema sp. DC36]|uniref:hypothetical protein n=1 Tax=Natrinema sp. DC36 TaxID=2878680 RepID=UPI001CF05487|nr:hypothetical protein [Natrinema sp. DC36]
MPPEYEPSTSESESRSRRAVLLSIGAGSVALAGCLNAADGGDDSEVDDGPTTDETTDDVESLPAYADWLLDDDSVLFSYASLDTSSEVGGGGFSLDDSIDDPLMTFPSEVGGSAVGLSVLSLASTNLSAVVDPETATQSEADELLAVNEAVVLTGAFDVEELNERLTDDSTPFAATYEQSGTVHGFDRYEPTDVPEQVEDTLVVAISETTVLAAPDDDQLERIAETDDNDRPQITEEHETATWLLEQAGEGDIIFGTIGPVHEGEYTLDDVTAFTGDELQFEPAVGEDVVTAIEVDAETATIDSRFALTADELSEDRQTTVETTFGSAAVDATVDVDDDRAIAHGTYDVEEIGTMSDGAGSDEREEITPEEARELVPLDALEYWYQPATGQRLPQLWVQVTEDTDATGLRVEAGSWGENEVTRTNSTISAGDGVPVQVDPDEDDEVTVFAVTDDDAIGQLDTVGVPSDELTDEVVVPEDALSFEYEPPNAGDFGSLSVEIVEETMAEVLVVQPTEAPGSFADYAGSIGAAEAVSAETTLQTAVDSDGDEVIIFATLNGATGEVARWQGPDQ